MLEASAADSYDTELRRVVDRLRSLPIAKLEASQDIVESLALQLLCDAQSLGSAAPAGGLPQLKPWGYGDMIMVLGSDLRMLATQDAELTSSLAALTAARQQLP
ncbi:MAG: hypothetical protein Q7K25_07870 [Actinomycetota bacterium]|nr:hypothetical protein [Actinomycetota bacterium]